MEHEFKIHIIDAEGNTKIQYLYDGEHCQWVDPEKPSYIDWCIDNEPEVVAYIAPEQPPEASIENKRGQVRYMASSKQDRSYDNGFDHLGLNYPSSLQHREFMVTGVRLALADSSFNATVFTSDGVPQTMNATEIQALLATYDVYGLSIYNLYILEMTTVNTATEAELDYYITNEVFE